MRKPDPHHAHGAFTQAVEDYLKAIYEFEEDGDAVSTTALSSHFDVSPAAATRMVKHLAERRLVTHTPYYGARLTPEGVAVAVEVIRHHRLLEMFLHRVLGYSWDEVDAEAERLEHHISEEFEDRVDLLLGFPETDPHGDPIPRRDGVIPPTRGIRLSDAGPGEEREVARVRDSDPGILRFLASVGLTLGARFVVCDIQPFNGPLTLLLNGESVVVGREVASNVFVVPLEGGDAI